MVSKESEYLIHIAEEQLERLNESIYFYQKNSEVESDILSSSSISMNYSNTFKNSSSNNVNVMRNGFDIQDELEPIYDIIRKQRDESLSASTLPRKIKETGKKKQFQKIPLSCVQADHIRDWRNGVNLVKRTLGPNNKVPFKYPTSKSESASPCSSKKKERVSTFWNDKSNKRNSKSPNKDTNTNSQRAADNCCSRKSTHDKEDIQKYIKNKQKLARMKRSEAEMTTKSRKENIKSSLNNLQTYHYDKFNQYKFAKQNNLLLQNESYYTKSSSMSSLPKPKVPTPIYDELEKDGMLDYIDLGTYDPPFTANMSIKYRNGLNSTVDSGIETGEWHRSLTPDKFKNSYDRIDEHIWTLPPTFPPLSKPTSQIDLRKERKYKDTKFKAGYNKQSKEVYQEQISAYDASSENEVVPESDDFDFKINSPSVASSTVSAETLMNHLNHYLNRMKAGSNVSKDFPLSNSKSKQPYPTRSSNDIDTISKTPIDSLNKDKSVACRIQDLKDALLNAQFQLKLTNKDCEQDLSEKISHAIQNFIKVVSNINETDGPKRSQSCASPQFPQSLNENKTVESKFKTDQVSESVSSRKKRKKDLLTEHSTDSQIETGETFNEIPNSNIDENHDDLFEEIPIDKTLDVVDDNDDTLTVIEINKEIPRITEIKKKLECRQIRAKALIKLTKDLHKESKRVIRLEKKASEISKRFLSNIKEDKKDRLASPICSPRLNSENKNKPKKPNDVLSVSGMDLTKPEDYQKTKMTSQQSNKPNDLSQSDKSSLSQLSLSENDEITVSISEITTTLTDQSELEARLLALRSEMDKKKDLVSKLKKRQKDLKREKIKQKEEVLQKQIEMYDNYIDKLQLSVDQINSKMDDNISDDSHTLTGSTSNLNDLDSKLDNLDKQYFQDEHDLLKKDIDCSQNVGEINLKKMIPQLSGDHIELDNNIYTNLLSDSNKDSFDLMVENNKQFHTGEIDLDSLCLMQKDGEDNSEQDNEILIVNNPDMTSVIDFSSPKFKKQNDVHENMGDNVIECIQAPKKDNKNDICVNLEIDDDSTRECSPEDTLIVCKTDEPLIQWDDLVQPNILAGVEDETESVLEQLYRKEISYDNGNTNAVLDTLVSINNNPSALLIDFSKSVNSKLPILETVANGSSESTDLPDEKQSSKTPQYSIEEINQIEKEPNKYDDLSSLTDSLANKKDDLYSDINSISASFSEKSKHSTSTSSIAENNKLEEFDLNIVEIEENAKHDLQQAEIISDDRSSISDVDSFNNFIEDDSLEDPNIRKLSPRNFETNLQSLEQVLETAPSPPLLNVQNSQRSDHFVDSENMNSFSNETFNSVHVEELVDTLLNAIILNEIANIKPILAEVEKENEEAPKILTTTAVSEYQSTSFIDQDFENLPWTTEETADEGNVLKSEDLWDLNDLTFDGPWEVNDPSTAINRANEVNATVASAITSLDKKLLSEKIAWLIPLKFEYIDPLIDCAIKHFHESRSNRSEMSTEEALLAAHNNLSNLFTNDDPIVTEKEIESMLFDLSTQQPYMDKRIIFKIVLEIFLEIYSFEKHLPESSWIHSSFKVKNNVHSLWKGDTPPESYDLVRKIVREHISVLISQKNVFLPDEKLRSKDNDSQSKIIKWCIRQQKDEVDKLLINDLRKEENEWIYYDESEEEVKFQIAEEIFNLLLFDTISWVKSNSNQN